MELRGNFLRGGRLAAHELRPVIYNIRLSFKYNSPHMLALARLALNSYTEEQVHALLFCIIRLTSDGIRRLIERL